MIPFQMAWSAGEAGVPGAGRRPCQAVLGGRPADRRAAAKKVWKRTSGRGSRRAQTITA